MTRTSLALVAALIATPAWATFEITTDFSDQQKFFIDTAEHNVSAFTGHADSVLIDVTTVGRVDTGSGFSTIKPAKHSLLNDLTFTPLSDSAFDAVSFRGQLVVPHSIEVDVWDQHGVESIFDFSALANADFGRLGIWSPDGSTISRVAFIAPFAEFKQVEFGATSAVPEASTWAMLLAGFGLLGYAAYRRVPHAHAR